MSSEFVKKCDNCQDTITFTEPVDLPGGWWRLQFYPTIEDEPRGTEDHFSNMRGFRSFKNLVTGVAMNGDTTWDLCSPGCVVEFLQTHIGYPQFIKAQPNKTTPISFIEPEELPEELIAHHQPVVKVGDAAWARNVQAAEDNRDRQEASANAAADRPTPAPRHTPAPRTASRRSIQWEWDHVESPPTPDGDDAA